MQQTIHDCDTLLGQLSLCLDNLLSEDECAGVHVELARCRTCQAFYQAMLEADQTLRVAPMKAPQQDMTPQVMALIAQRETRQTRALGFTLLLSGAMSIVPTLVVLLGLVIGLWTSTNPGILQSGVDIAFSIVHTIAALFLALGTVQNAFSPWLLPAFAALASILILSLTVVWARQVTLAPSAVRA
jgi:anti-sigma factor RsiW